MYRGNWGGAGTEFAFRAELLPGNRAEERERTNRGGANGLVFISNLTWYKNALGDVRLTLPENDMTLMIPGTAANNYA